jgi:hypothetical protein
MKILITFFFLLFANLGVCQNDTVNFRGNLNRLDSETKKLNQKIDDYIKTSNLNYESSKKMIDSLKNRLFVIENENKKLLEDNKNLRNDFEAKNILYDRNIEDISYSFIKSNVIGIIITAFITAALIFLTITFIRKIRQSSKTVEEKALNIDKELLDLMAKQINLLSDTSKTANKQITEEEVDHSLAIRVADEINRISMRTSKMDDNSRDVQAVKNALKRIESELNQKGYEIIIKNGDVYKDTMTFLPINFVAVKGLNPGEQIINRTIKPQITFNSKLIQQGEIEVGVHEDDLA